MKKGLRGDQKPCGKAVESRQDAQIVSEMEPHTRLLSTESHPGCTHKQYTLNTNIIVNLC